MKHRSSSSSKRRRRRLFRLPRRALESTLRLVKRPFEWIEDVFEAAFKKVSSIQDVFTRLERRGLNIGERASWPFKVFGRTASHVWKLLIPWSVLKAVSKPLRRTGRRLVQGFVRLAGVLFLDRLVIRLAKVSRPLWYPLAALGGFADKWRKTRKLKRLLWGVPIIILLLPLPLVASWHYFRGHDNISTDYRIAIEEARGVKDYARIDLFERKLGQIGVATQHLEFQTALAMAKDGKLPVAYQKMQRLAPTDYPGYPPAHLWMVDRLSKGELDVVDTEADRLIGVHLGHIATLGIKSDGIDLVRARWLAKTHKEEEAAALLKPLIYKVPPAAIEKMRLDLVMKRMADARQDALVVRSHMEARVRKADSLTDNEYHWWTAAENVLGDATRLRGLLHDWLTAYPQDVRARDMLSALSLREIDDTLNAEPASLELRIREVFYASEVRDEAKDRITVLYYQRQSYPQVAETFETLLNSPNLPPALSEILGTAAAVEGNWELAKPLLQRAVEQDQKNAIAWNNLAVALMQLGDTELAGALAASNRALELKPEDYRFRETHGELLLRTGKYQEAVNDLEFALNGMPDVQSIHVALSKAYSALGDKKLAAIHQEYAK